LAYFAFLLILSFWRALCANLAQQSGLQDDVFGGNIIWVCRWARE
jgi:hypothetical protein